MKREFPLHIPPAADPFYGGAGGSKPKMWRDDGGADELLAVLGYNVKASDMADVAQKIEHLEGVLGHNNNNNNKTTPPEAAGQEGGLNQVVSDSAHYNPSDLSTWLESMITDLNPDDSFLAPFPSDYELGAIPGKAAFPQNQNQNHPNKRFKPTFELTPEEVIMSESTRHLIVAESQENGVRLVHTLIACAEAIQQNQLKLAEALVKQIGFLAVSQPGPMRKVATYFAEALARRIYRLFPEYPQESAFSDLLQMHFYETCPYLKFAHFTANQAILEAFENKRKVHVIDFGMKQGMQWPALMQALALRPGGPPTFRLTGIGPPSIDETDHLQEVGWKLAELAGTINVEFEYRGFVANTLADLEPTMLNLRDDETVAVNSVFELHQLLALPGAIERVLTAVKEMKPEIWTVVEQEADHNGPVFMDRFNSALHYYSTLFDSLESSGGDVMNQDKVMSELYLGRQICNVIACEGVDRTERHETLAQWKTRFESAGYEAVHLGSNAFKQASMLLALFNGGGGYEVEENGGCLMLGWQTRSLIATSAWKLGEE